MFCFSKQFNFLLATAVCLATLHEFVIGTTTPASTEISEDSSDTATVTPFMTRDRISIMHYRYKMRQEIRNKVLAHFGWTSVPQIRPRDREIINITLANISSIRVTEQQCFTASCELPNRIDENMWNDSTSGSLRVIFDVLPSDQSTNPEIVNATLMLHLKERVLCNCADDADLDRISIKVLQYLKPLRRRSRARGRANRRSIVRQRVLWTSMVPWVSNTWVSVPVHQAANDWIVLNRRNHGFEVLVYDQYDQPIDSNVVFSGIECRQQAELDCMEAFLDLNPLLRNTSPILRVFKSESPFVNQRKKRDVSREFTQTSLVRLEGTHK